MLLYYYLRIFHRRFLEDLKHDVYAVYKASDYTTMITALKCNLEFRILYYFRASNFFSKNIFLGSLIKSYYVKLSSNYCVTINPETKIGLGFRLGHIGNIIVHSKTIIGNNVTISQGVTIGKIHKGRLAGTPTFGDRIYVGPNAIIVGHINIGNDVIIAGNSFVNFDVPNNSVVLGNPGVVHFKENPTKDVLNLLFDNESFSN
jgi:serine O-acetyltransferase